MGGGLSPLQFTHQCANYRNHCRGPGTLRHDGINTMLTRQRMQQRHCRKICALRRTHAHNRGSALGRLNEEQYFYEVLLFTRTKKSGVEPSELTALISVPSCNTSAFAASMSSSSIAWWSGVSIFKIFSVFFRNRTWNHGSHIAKIYAVVSP